MGSRTLPHYCGHGVPVDGGDFMDSEECKDCELTRFRDGYKGSCYACEAVGEKNVELEHKVRVLRDALDAIAESEWDASAGLLRDIANKALATAPEGGEV